MTYPRSCLIRRIAWMSDTLNRIRDLVASGAVRVSDDGYDELSKDNLTASEVIDGVADGELIEDYPDFQKGPCVLVLQLGRAGSPLHVVWGIPKGADSPAVLVTAYRPDPDRWDVTFTRRRT